MKISFFIILFAMGAYSCAYAQCDQFDNLIQKGDAYLKGKKPNYQEAINAYTAAILACNDRAGEAQKRIGKMVSDINKLKENAVAAERKAAAAEKKATQEADATKKALADLEIQKARTDSALVKAEKLINAFYFYDGKFALAFKDNKFYFIDKNGAPVQQLGEYEKAEQFDDTGFAKVKNEGKDYLLDTFGTAYPIAYLLAAMNDSITALDLRGMHVDSFPDEILRYPQLEVLILNGESQEENKITLPTNIANLARLKSLQLRSCRLSSLPAEIGQLKNLRSLDLTGNRRLSSLPAEIGQLKNLQSINLSYNRRLSSLPAEIGQLKNLQSLDISGSSLSKLPPEVGQLKNLRSLDLSYNRELSSLPVEIGQLKNLQSLDLSGNSLSSLPAEIGQLQSLQSLVLRDNLLRSLPAEIGQLQSLRSLVLRDNLLTGLPAEIGQLKNLQELSILWTRLSSLPAEIGQLKNLQSLFLYGNQLSTLPTEIRNLKSLKILYLHRNPFSPTYIDQLRKDMPWCKIEF
jgi:Leucine-rich repeat (LRR) protein